MSLASREKILAVAAEVDALLKSTEPASGADEFLASITLESSTETLSRRKEAAAKALAEFEADNTEEALDRLLEAAKLYRQAHAHVLQKIAQARQDVAKMFEESRRRIQGDEPGMDGH